MLHFYGLLCGVHPFSWSQKHSQLQDGAVISKSLLMDLQFFCSTHFPFHARSECRLLKNPILCCQVPNRRPCMASVPCLLLHRKMFNYLEILLLVLPVLMMHRWYLGKQSCTERAQLGKSISETAEQLQPLLLLLGGTSSLSEKNNIVFKRLGLFFL